MRKTAAVKPPERKTHYLNVRVPTTLWNQIAKRYRPTKHKTLTSLVLRLLYSGLKHRGDQL